ncbi:MAG: heme ABC exporter ATP-binding protein CcmA [Paracoccaceae bacterium]|nr:heme ABC exporter ATP-binding protein CcmA [Paracoccaceae bacterium]MDG2259563.1 heme ABC exporter ATP-binding protein CcmA [Paracoccaceae bacterium]
MAMHVENLAVSRGGILILEGIDFQLSAGQALVLRGPNGSGKTTLLRTLAGLQPIADGKITYDIDSVAYAAHSDGLKQMLTVRENLEFWSSVFGTGNIDEAVEAFFLGPLLTRMAGALSAGQKRRLGLARLLVTGRPIWVLDEPTVSLDVEAVARFGETIKTHLQSGGSALIATHIDLGIPADILDVTPFKAKRPSLPQLDGAFQ